MEQPVQHKLSQPSIQPSITQPSSNQQTTLPEPSETTPPSTLKSLLFVAAIVIFLVLGGVVGYISLKQSNSEVPAPATVQTTQKSATNYVGTQTIALRDLSGGNSSGTVTRTITEDYVRHHVTATLPYISENTFYEVWIIRADGQDIPVDELRKSDANDDFTLMTEHYPLTPASVPFEQLFNTIVISFETADDFSMETKILEGTFTQ